MGDVYSWNVRDESKLDREGILKKWCAACKLPGEVPEKGWRSKRSRYFKGGGNS